LGGPKQFKISFKRNKTNELAFAGLKLIFIFFMPKQINFVVKRYAVRKAKKGGTQHVGLK